MKNDNIKIGDLIEYQKGSGTWTKGRVCKFSKGKNAYKVWCHWEDDNGKPRENLTWMSRSRVRLVQPIEARNFEEVLDREVNRLKGGEA